MNILMSNNVCRLGSFIICKVRIQGYLIIIPEKKYMDGGTVVYICNCFVTYTMRGTGRRDKSVSAPVRGWGTLTIDPAGDV